MQEKIKYSSNHSIYWGTRNAKNENQNGRPENQKEYKKIASTVESSIGDIKQNNK